MDLQGPGADPAPRGGRSVGSCPGPPCCRRVRSIDVPRTGNGRRIRSSARCVFARRRLAGNLPAPLRAAAWGRPHRHVRDLPGPPREEGSGRHYAPMTTPLSTVGGAGRQRRIRRTLGVPCPARRRAPDVERQRPAAAVVFGVTFAVQEASSPSRHRDLPGASRARGPRGPASWPGLGRSGGDRETTCRGRRPRGRGQAEGVGATDADASRAACRSSPRRGSGSARPRDTCRRRACRSRTSDVAPAGRAVRVRRAHDVAGRVHDGDGDVRADRGGRSPSPRGRAGRRPGGRTGSVTGRGGERRVDVDGDLRRHTDVAGGVAAGDRDRVPPVGDRLALGAAVPAERPRSSTAGAPRLRTGRAVGPGDHGGMTAASETEKGIETRPSPCRRWG